MTSTSTRKLASTPNVELINPIMGGITAPPAMAMTISPEISLTRAGSLSTEMAKMSGNRLADPRPISKMATRVTSCEGESSSYSMLANASREV